MAKREKSDIVSGLGTAFQILKSLRDGGASDEDLRRLLKEEGLVEKVVSLLRVGIITNDQQFPSSTLAADLIPTGWTIVEDVAPSTFRVSDLKFKSFLQEGESWINSDTMRQRAVEFKGNLGLVDGKFLLAHQDEIPTELRNKYIVLPGTVLRHPDGGLRVPCLDFRGDRWCLDFRWLGLGFSRRGRFACSE